MKRLIRRWLPTVSEPTASDRRLVERIFDSAKHARSLSNLQLASDFSQLRVRVANGVLWSHTDILVPAFGLICEAMRRSMGVEPYDVQVLAGIVLARGSIAEMQTGEGKTLTSAFPALLFSLADRGVHMMTVNAYLAERDFEKLQPLYQILDVPLGVLKPNQSPTERQTAYDAGVTYGPGYEFGFDYLRDQMVILKESNDPSGWTRTRPRGLKSGPRKARQRGQCFAIVDEADSVLIDEAITPLVISGQPYAPHPHPQPYFLARQITEQLRPQVDFNFDGNRGIQLSSEAKRKLSTRPETSELGTPLQRPWLQYIEQALAARYLFRRDVDYVVTEGRVRIVDQNTGRIHADRTWQDGLQQAVEAQEGVTISQEDHSLARISRQRYFRLYDHCCGLTGTAASAARELAAVYNLPVVTIPLRTPSRRVTLPTRYFSTLERKWDSIVEDVQARHNRRQPILIGTRTIDQSETLATRFHEIGLPFELLNGKQTREEAEIVAQAGQQGAITIATNLAGRGTDIQLGPGVAELGGLHVIGAERNESERIDRQLVGRCARQGDPGSCQFFVSAEDLLIAKFSPVLARQMTRLAESDGNIRVDLSAQVRSVQRKVERIGHRKRQSVASYDEWRMELVSKLS